MERVAVRATVSFASNGMEEIGDGDSDGFSLGPSVSGLFYVQPSGPFRVYLSPRYSYSRSSSTSSIEVPSFSPPFTITTVTVSTESKNHSHGGAGLVGVEYRLGERFAVFGEAGLQYIRSRSSFTRSGGLPLSIPSPSERWTFGSTGGVGVSVYF